MVRIGAFVKKFSFAALSILVAISLGRRVWKNLEGMRRVSFLKNDISYLVIENERLKENLSERMSLEFVEKEAREKLGMVKEGEKVVILSEEDGGGEEERAVLGFSRKVSYWREWAGVFGW